MRVLINYWTLMLLVLISCKNDKNENGIVQFSHVSVVEIPAGESKKITVKALNESDDDVSFKDYVVSCGCSKVTFSNSDRKSTIIPGNKEINIYFDVTTSIEEKNRQKEILCSFKTDGKPMIKEVTFIVKVI